MRNDIKKVKYHKGIFDSYLRGSSPEKWGYGFAELMWGLGFEMDCYESYNARFGSTEDNGRHQKDIEESILQNLAVSDVQIIGNYIFSRYRELTHWSDYGYPPEKAEFFFPRAFELLIRKMEECRGTVTRVTISGE